MAFLKSRKISFPSRTSLKAFFKEKEIEKKFPVFDQNHGLALERLFSHLDY